MKATEPKQKQHPVVDVTGDGSKVWCDKEQYCIGTWNVRSMNQGKLEVVKQKMAAVNINILGISKLKWTGMGEFNSDDHYIYYCGQESLRRNEVAISQQKSLKCSTWTQSQKRQNDLCLFPRQTIQYYSNPSLCLDQCNPLVHKLYRSPISELEVWTDFQSEHWALVRSNHGWLWQIMSFILLNNHTV